MGFPASEADDKEFNSRPVSPNSFSEKPFGENVEGLSHFRDESCGFMIVFKRNGAVNEPHSHSHLPGSIGIGKRSWIHACQSGVTRATVSAA